MNALSKAGVVQKEFDGKEYALKLMNLTDSITVGQQLMELLALPIGAAYDGGLFTGEDFKDLDIGKHLAQALNMSMGKADVLNLVKKLLTGLYADGAPVNLEEDFKGKEKGKIIPLCIWSVQENGLTPETFTQGFLEMGTTDIFSEILLKNKMTTTEDTSKE